MELGKIEVERMYFLPERDSRKFDKYLKTIGVSESDFIKRKIKGVIEEIQLDEEVDLLINEVLEKLGCNHESFFEGRSMRPNPSARRVISYILRTKYNYKLWDIGRKLKRDHSSILSHIRWIEDKEGLEHLYPEEFETIEYIIEKFRL